MSALELLRDARAYRAVLGDAEESGAPVAVRLGLACGLHGALARLMGDHADHDAVTRLGRPTAAERRREAKFAHHAGRLVRAGLSRYVGRKNTPELHAAMKYDLAGITRLMRERGLLPENQRLDLGVTSDGRAQVFRVLEDAVQNVTVTGTVRL